MRQLLQGYEKQRVTACFYSCFIPPKLSLRFGVNGKLQSVLQAGLNEKSPKKSGFNRLINSVLI